MKEEIKEILDIFKQVYEDNNNGIKYEDFNTGYMNIPTYQLYPGDCKLLYDCITNLQQGLDKANDIIKKDRQFYKCRMDEYAELKKENERLNNKIKEQNLLLIEFQDMEQKLDIYKSRCEKVNDFIDNYDVFKEFSFPLMKRDIENQIKSSIDYEFNSTFRKKFKNILQGSDENE